MATGADAKAFPGLDSETKRNIDNSQAEVLQAMKQTGNFQSITVEYHGNGTIKSIKRDLDLKNVLTMGVLSIVAGVTIYYIGPSNVTEYAKAALVAAEAMQKISETVSGRPVVGKKEEKHTVFL